MDYVLMIAQLAIALGILTVWLLRFIKATAYRAGTARNMRGVRLLRTAAVVHVGGRRTENHSRTFPARGFWLPDLVRPAAIGMALLMLRAVGMHIKVGAPMEKSAPAAILLILSLVVTTI